MSEVQGGEGEEKGGKASQELYWSRFFSPPFRWGKKGLALFLEKEAVAVYVQYTKKTLLLCGKVEAEANPVSFRFFIFYSGRRGKRLLLLRRRPLKMTILPILSPFSLHWRRFRPILLPRFLFHVHQRNLERFGGGGGREERSPLSGVQFVLRPMEKFTKI